MAWRRGRAEFEAGKGEGNRRALRKLAASKLPPGILLYRDSEVVGWCSVAPREQFARLAASRVWSPIDDQPVWSVSCFFVKREFRNQGLSVELLKAAVLFAQQHGAKIVEGYPQDLDGRLPDAFVWTGLAGSYRRAGFKEAARRSKSKPILRHGIPSVR
jgi:GNAT superfamily N-acetyltransferase